MKNACHRSYDKAKNTTADATKMIVEMRSIFGIATPREHGDLNTRPELVQLDLGDNPQLFQRDVQIDVATVRFASRNRLERHKNMP